MFLLECPRCRKQMKYQSQDGRVAGKRKNCVYCNRSMDVGKSLVKKL